MEIEPLSGSFTVCKADAPDPALIGAPFVFTASTDAERSLVCPTALVPAATLAREDGWRGFRVAGSLDFGLIGILARITAALASAKIGVFVVSTFDTDYIFVKEAAFARAVDLARAALADV